MPNAARHRLVLVGGGHAHVQVLEAYAKTPLPKTDVTVVVDDPVAMYSGMAPGFVAGQYARRELEIDVRPLAEACDAHVIVARCERIDPRARRLILADGVEVPYDVASLNIGSKVIGLDLPGVREHALPTRPLHRLVDGVAGLVEQASSHSGEVPFHVTVVGAGAGGVELAFTTQSRLARESGRRIDVTLLDSGRQILARFPASLVRRVTRLCNARGIAIRMGHRVVEIHEAGLTLDDGTALSCDALLWVTGPTGHTVFSDSGLATDERGFALVRSTLQLREHDDLFAAGDCSTMIEHPDTPKAGVYAVRMGPIIARNLRARLAGESLDRYRPQGDFLMLLNVGDGTALGAKWGLTVGGRWVMRWKDRIDRAFMRRFQYGNDGRAAPEPDPRMPNA